jgi:hypothetical protein
MGIGELISSQPTKMAIPKSIWFIPVDLIKDKRID